MAESCGLALAGPHARALLERLTDDDLSTAAPPFLGVIATTLGLAPVRLARLGLTGGPDYEIRMRHDMQRHVFEALMTAGADLGLRPFGLRALNALRLERGGWGGWAREFRPVHGPEEAGLDPLIAWSKPDFIGKTAAQAARGAGAMRLVTLEVETDPADALGDEPIWHDAAVVGWVASGGYAHHAGRSVALGYVPRAAAEATDGFAVEILGALRPARRLAAPLFDPAGGLLRA